MFAFCHNGHKIKPAPNGKKYGEVKVRVGKAKVSVKSLHYFSASEHPVVQGVLYFEPVDFPL